MASLDIDGVYRICKAPDLDQQTPQQFLYRLLLLDPAGPPLLRINFTACRLKDRTATFRGARSPPLLAVGAAM